MKTSKQRVTRNSLFKDSRGAVFAESVIMLPFFILILQGYTFVHSTYRTRIVVFQQTKACAWDYANRGCTGAAASCRVQDQGPLGAGEGIASLRTAPVIGPLMTTLFGTRAKYTKTQTINRPAFFGGGTFDVTGEQVLACNTQPTGLMDLLGDLVSSIFSGNTGALSGTN